MNTSSAAPVRRAALDDATTVGSVLAAAFTDAPVGAWLLADRAARKRLLRRLFTNLAGWAAVHGAVYHRVDGAGAALWLPINGGQDNADLLADDRTGGSPEHAFAAALHDLDGAPDLLGDGQVRLHALARLHRLAALLHPASVLSRETTRLPVFLLALGVDPDARRKRVAEQLLAAHHRVLYERYAPSVAVAVDPVGQALYAAAGYQPHHVDQVGDGVPLQWMLRDPS